MLKPFSPGFSRGVDSPLVRGGEFPDEFVLDEEVDGFLAQVAGGEGPDWRSLPLDLDGGIVDGLLRHPSVVETLRLEAASWVAARSVRDLSRLPVTVGVLTNCRLP